MDKKIRRYTIIISIFLHLIIFFIAERTVNFKLLGTDDIPEIINDPIVFDLNDDKQPKEIIETTEDQRSKQKAEKPDYFSDKNSIAKNPDPGKEIKEGSPYSEGDLNIPALPEITRKGDPKDAPKKTEQDKKEKVIKRDKNRDSISEDRKDIPEENDINPGGSINNQILRKNILAKVKKLGGFAFNTYDWNFAPYMLELKRRIQNNIFPPIAFSRLGIINGETLLRFRIYPDGKLETLELLKTKGHQSLVDTSVEAVKISAPFPPLPEDFPKQFLEVTGKFIYFIRR